MKCRPFAFLTAGFANTTAQAFQHGSKSFAQIGLRPQPPTINGNECKIVQFSDDEVFGKRTICRQPTFILSKQTGSNEDENGPIQEESSNFSAPQSTSPTNNRSIIAQITLFIFNLFSYTIQFLGALFTFGLVLNLLGYGYRFDFDHGLEINRLENIRNEVQFEREIIREEREDYLKERSEGKAGNSNKLVIGNWGKSVLGK